jgi:hypothetical protein
MSILELAAVRNDLVTSMSERNLHMLMIGCPHIVPTERGFSLFAVRGGVLHPHSSALRVRGKFLTHGFCKLIGALAAAFLMG